MSSKMWDQYRHLSKGWKVDPIAKVHPRIYLGSAFEANIGTFSKLNITHSINCAGPEYSSVWFKSSYPDRYVCIDAVDSLNAILFNYYPLFESTMNKFLADPECKNIYVHCQCGINRSAFLLLIYLCTKFQYKLEPTIKNISSQRPCCFTNVSFRIQATNYIKKLE